MAPSWPATFRFKLVLVVSCFAALFFLNFSAFVRIDAKFKMADAALFDPFIKVAAISDIHGQYSKFDLQSFKDIDLLLVVGDMINKNVGDPVALFAQLQAFNDDFLASLLRLNPALKIIAIAGNHESHLLHYVNAQRDAASRIAVADDETEWSRVRTAYTAVDSLLRTTLSNAIYLQNRTVSLQIKNRWLTVWGTSFQCVLPFKDDIWRFSCAALSERVFRAVPHKERLDVVMTHDPPFGHGALPRGKGDVGLRSVRADLLDAAPQLKLYAFGHVHGGAAEATLRAASGNRVQLVRASVCDDDNRFLPQRAAVKTYDI